MKKENPMRGYYETWGRWYFNGGWNMAAPVGAPQYGVMGHADGFCHSDPVGDYIERMYGVELVTIAATQVVYGGLPELTRAVIYETFVEPLAVDKNDRVTSNALVTTICQEWRISVSAYWKHLNEAYTCLRRHLETMENAAA